MTYLSDGVVRHLREVADRPDLGGTKYRLIRRLGAGGMGAVYLVEDVDLGREAALKVLGVPDPGGDLSSRLLSEARLIAALEHPNIVPVHDVGTLPDGRVYYVMKLVRGRRLDEWMRDSVPGPALLRLFQKVCEAVAFAHARGIVHRDLKPENIMVGEFGEALVMDWGVAKSLQEGRGDGGPAPEVSTPPQEPHAMGDGTSGIETADAPRDLREGTRDGTLIGTPAYMAPEQARGEVGRIDERTDVYALGAILFHLLCGVPPYEGPSAAAILERVRSGKAPSPRQRNASVPKALDAVCRKAMSAAPEDRYASAAGMAGDVERFLDGGPVSAHRETMWDKGVRILEKNRTFALLLLAYLCMRLLVILIFS